MSPPSDNSCRQVFGGARKSSAFSLKMSAPSVSRFSPCPARRSARVDFVIKNEIAARVLNVQRRNAGKHKLIELAQYSLEGQLSIRVPSEQTQLFLRALARQIGFLAHRNFEAVDVQFKLPCEALA